MPTQRVVTSSTGAGLTRVSRHALLSAALLLLPFEGRGEDKGASTRLSVRVAPTADRAARSKVFEVLNALSTPERVALPAGKSVEAQVKEQCGFVTLDVLSLVQKTNPGLSLAASDSDREFDLPTCPYWEFDRSFKALGGGEAGARQIMKTHMGADGPVSREWLLQANPDLEGSIARVEAGQMLRFPYVSRSISLRLRPELASQASQVARTLATDLGRLALEAPTPEPSIDLVREASADAVGSSCLTTSEAARWPLDRKGLLDVLLKSSAASNLSPVHVVIADTGLARDDINLLPLHDNIQEGGDKEFNGKDDDGDGFHDDRFGARMDPPGGFPALDPDYPRASHGTEVASLVAGGGLRDELAEAIGRRVHLSIANIVRTHRRAGAAPDWEITETAVQNSLRFARAVRAQVINWSFQSQQPMPNVRDRMRDSDTLLAVVAAGNDGETLGLRRVFPASYTAELPGNIITVAAHGPDGELLPFSNRGATTIDLAAAGCAVGALTVAGTPKQVAGTSFAAPLVSLAAALLAQQGLVQPAEIKRRIMSTVELDSRLENAVRSGGRLDIVKALAIDYDAIESVGADGMRRMRLGHIEAPRTRWEICGRSVPREDILRIVPRRRPGTSAPTWVLLRAFDSAGQLSGDREEYCPLPETNISFVEGGGPREVLPLAQLLDVVPAWRNEPHEDARGSTGSRASGR